MPEDVVAPLDHCVEGGLSPSREGAHGQPWTPGQSGRQRRAGVEQRAGPAGLDRHQPTKGGARPGAVEFAGVDSAAPQVVLGKVDAAPPSVLGHVLEVLDHLQPVTDVVGQGDAIGSGGSEHHQHKASHRSGRQAAVPQEVLEGLVCADPLVHPVGLDQGRKRVERQSEIPQGRGEALEQRVAGPALGRPMQLGLQPVQLGEPITLGLVADVVCQPGEAVDGHEVGAHRSGQEQRGDGKVLAAGLDHHPG